MKFSSDETKEEEYHIYVDEMDINDAAKSPLAALTCQLQAFHWVLGWVLRVM